MDQFRQLSYLRGVAIAIQDPTNHDRPTLKERVDYTINRLIAIASENPVRLEQAGQTSQLLQLRTFFK
jgi:hypothetical protein